MREAFTAALAAIEGRLDDALASAVVTLAGVADAVVDPTPQGSQEVAWSALQLRCASRGADADLVTITACQAPVASDLRLVLSLIQIAQHVGLIANQFDLIGQQLSEAGVGVSDRLGTGGTLADMAMRAGALLGRAAGAFEARDLDAARAIEADDDEIDRLNRVVFEAARALEGGPDERALGLRHVLIARSLERIGDNAVDIADQLPFLITAQMSRER